MEGLHAIPVVLIMMLGPVALVHVRGVNQRGQWLGSAGIWAKRTGAGWQLPSRGR